MRLHVWSVGCALMLAPCLFSQCVQKTEEHWELFAHSLEWFVHGRFVGDWLLV